jgi:hypothetical protein
MAHTLWEGLSLFDKKPIAVIATGMDSPSRNRKTGPMVQTFILPQNIHPSQAISIGQDGTICGDCKHRGHTLDGKARSCYVVMTHGPNTAWNKYRAGEAPYLGVGSSPKYSMAQLGVRFGAYGDPAAAPSSLWLYLANAAKGFFTGYTHQWRTAGPNLKVTCMASVDTPEEAEQAKAMGWRYFPADKGDKSISCSQCKACCGTSRGMKSNIVINVHGPTWRKVAFDLAQRKSNAQSNP